MDVISLDNIDTTAAWRVETERPTMELIPDWLDVNPEALVPKEVAVAREEESEEEEEERVRRQSKRRMWRRRRHHLGWATATATTEDRGHLFYLLLEDDWVHLYPQGQGLLPLEKKAKPFPIPIKGARDLHLSD